MDPNPPTTTPALCTQYKIYWRDCGHEYSNVGDVVPCQAAANNLPCACRTNLRILRDTTTSRGIDGHTRVLSDETETGVCRPCRLSNERERKKEAKKQKKKVSKADKGKKVDGGSKVSGTGDEGRSGFGGGFGRERNFSVEKKYVKVDGGGIGSKDDWEVGMPPKTIKQYQMDLGMLKESNGTGTGKAMSL